MPLESLDGKLYLDGVEVSPTGSTVTTYLATDAFHQDWITKETQRKLAETPNISVVPLGGIATLNAKTYSARLPMPSNFSIRSVSVSAGTAGSGGTGGSAATFRILNKGSAITSTITLANNATTYTVTPQTSTGATGPVIISGTDTDNYLQVQVQTVGSTPPKNVTFSLTIGTQ